MTSNGLTGSERELAEIDTSVAHAARVYDYLLGGRANFAVDRAAAERAYVAWPGGLDGVRADARAHRAVLGRMVQHLARDAGISSCALSSNLWRGFTRSLPKRTTAAPCARCCRRRSLS